jgi:hypothetical protein
VVESDVDRGDAADAVVAGAEVGTDLPGEEHRPAGGEAGVEAGEGDRFDPRRVAGSVVAGHVGDLEVLPG